MTKFEGKPYLLDDRLIAEPPYDSAGDLTAEFIEVLRDQGFSEEEIEDLQEANQ